MTGYGKRTVERWKRAIAPYCRPAPRAVAARSALLVVDMQRYFQAMCDPIAATVREAVDGCRSLGMPLLFTQHGHADPRTDGGMLAAWWGDLILEGTADHRLMQGLGREPGDSVFAKRRYDAFFGTELEAELRRRGIEELAMAGVMTNLCVETTSRSAFVRDFRVRVLMDATATADEQMHVASLVNMAYGFAHVQTAEQWLSDMR